MAMKRGSVIMPNQLKLQIERLSTMSGLSYDAIITLLSEYINDANNEIAKVELPFSSEGELRVKSIVNGRFTK